jgi:hypothetical protein
MDRAYSAMTSSGKRARGAFTFLCEMLQETRQATRCAQAWE